MKRKTNLDAFQLFWEEVTGASAVCLDKMRVRRIRNVRRKK
jgi:hypothetical protein